MQMLSTRGGAAVTPSMAILRGLAPDGGLYVPASFPTFTAAEIEAMVPMRYAERAFAVLSRFLPGIAMGGYLVSTTTVSEFTAAMLRLHLSEKIIIPLSVMFRFFPTVMDEAASINAAMRMRGIYMGGKNVGKMLEYRLVPLMTCCVKIGEELSAAALTRGLGGEVKRTNICKIGFHIQDYLLFVVCLIPYAVWIMGRVL